MLDWMEMVEVFQKGRKHWGKSRNCLLQKNSPFSTEFSVWLYCQQVKNTDFFGKGLNVSEILSYSLGMGKTFQRDILFFGKG